MTRPFLTYLICFVLALVIEFIALLPGLGLIGTSHGAGDAISEYEKWANLWFFVLHLPTSLVPWLLNKLLDIGNILYLPIPFFQIIFWIFFLGYCWKRLKNFMES